MANRKHNLRDDLQVAVDKHVEGVGHDAFGGIFDRHDAVIRAAFGDFGEDVSNGLLGEVVETGAKSVDGRLVRKRRLGTEIGDGHHLLQAEGAGHDFAVDGAKTFVGDRPLVFPANALEHGQFSMRRVNLLAVFELDCADLEDEPGALVEESHDLFVERVDGLAELRNSHAEWTIATGRDRPMADWPAPRRGESVLGTGVAFPPGDPERWPRLGGGGPGGFGRRNLGLARRVGRGASGRRDVGLGG